MDHQLNTTEFVGIMTDRGDGLIVEGPAVPLAYQSAAYLNTIGWMLGCVTAFAFGMVTHAPPTCSWTVR